jgi:hypothetical protein
MSDCESIVRDFKFARDRSLAPMGRVAMKAVAPADGEGDAVAQPRIRKRPAAPAKATRKTQRMTASDLQALQQEPQGANTADEAAGTVALVRRDRNKNTWFQSQKNAGTLPEYVKKALTDIQGTHHYVGWTIELY